MYLNIGCEQKQHEATKIIAHVVLWQSKEMSQYQKKNPEA